MATSNSARFVVDKALDNDALTTGRKLEAEKAKIKTLLMYVVKESPQHATDSLKLFPRRPSTTSSTRLTTTGTRTKLNLLYLIEIR